MNSQSLAIVCLVIAAIAFALIIAVIVDLVGGWLRSGFQKGGLVPDRGCCASWTFPAHCFYCMTSIEIPISPGQAFPQELLCGVFLCKDCVADLHGMMELGMKPKESGPEAQGEQDDSNEDNSTEEEDQPTQDGPGD